MTLANRITFFRVFLIPVYCALIYSYTPDRDWLRWAALAVYVTAALSDILDGYIARNYNQRSVLGTRLDPLADKLIVNLGFVFLAVNPGFDPNVPLWFPVLVLLRDGTMVLGAYLVNELIGPIDVKPRILGKLTTIVQTAAMIAVLLQVFFAPLLLYAAVAFTVASFIDYMYTGTAEALKRRQAA